MDDIAHEFEAVTRAFSGFGVDENSLISTLGNWHEGERKLFRKGAPQFFIEDDRLFERWNLEHIAQLKTEFLRFKDALVLWTMHPWERDARLAKEALKKGPESYRMLIEVACTRSSEELLGARRAYHSLFDHSIEEDVAHHIDGPERKLFLALVSSYRYEGQRVNDATAKSEAKTLGAAIKNVNNKKPVEDEEVVRILTTRSKLHLKAIYRHYKEMNGKNIDEDLDADMILKDTVQCLCIPQIYFSQVLDASVEATADENAKEALTRIMVTRTDVDMKEIDEEHISKYGYSLSDMIEDRTSGNFKDFLLTLITRGSRTNN